MTTPYTATPYKTNNNKSHKMDTSMLTQDAEATPALMTVCAPCTNSRAAPHTAMARWTSM